MYDAGTTALLRTILDEICDSVSLQETAVRTHVASKILKPRREAKYLPTG
jgi:hypothetical protein